MSDAPEAHRLGPHVVGVRVVVRRLVRGETGPSGGPAMTDVLGVCTSWGDGVCVVQPEGGDPVTIPLRDIVSGKPVPPRPSVRHRVPAREVELRARSLWPDLETEDLGEWVLRAAPPEGGRLLKRANSVLAMGDPGRPVVEAVEEVVEFYAARDRTPLAQVEAGGDVEAAVLEAGWSPLPQGASACLLASTARALRATSAVAGSPVVGRTSEVELVETGSRAEARIGDLASGRAAVDGDWLGVHAVHVAPEHRRQGLATAVMAELLDWGAAQGALTTWLHVELDNDPALRLYESLGFREHHRYRYLTPGDGFESPSGG